MIFTFKFRDKSYEFDDEQMSLGEARWAKAETGLVGEEFWSSVRKLDPDCISVLIVLAMRRAGESDATMESIAEDTNGYFEFLTSSQIKETPPNRAARRAKTSA